MCWSLCQEFPGIPRDSLQGGTATGKGQAFVHQVMEGHWPFTLGGRGPQGAETWRENRPSVAPTGQPQLCWNEVPRGGYPGPTVSAGGGGRVCSVPPTLWDRQGPFPYPGEAAGEIPGSRVIEM